MRTRKAWMPAWAIVFSAAALAPFAAAQEPAGDAESGRDRRFEAFVRRSAGTMVSDVAVEGERHLKVKVGESVSPEETLPLTKSLLAGARKDFPGELITVAVYDPAGHPILRARYRPEHGVDYEVVHSKGRDAHEFSHKNGSAPAVGTPGTPGVPSHEMPLPRGGKTEKDRKFAEWAEQHGHDYLRFVESDVEEHGRLWFGVTKAVKPDDVPALTKSLLEGAHKEFPRRELTATVFDPDGEKIGKAVLGANGQVQWTK